MDRSSKSIILSVRGTASLEDALLDLICEEDTFLDGFTHKGIKEAAIQVWTRVSSAIISGFHLYPDYDLILTGHSLGAGVAVLLTMELILGPSSHSLKHVCSTEKISCVALAPPPVFREQKSFLFRKKSTSMDSVKDKIHLFINDGDCIPRTSLGTLVKLVLTLRKLDNLQLTFSQIVKTLMEDSEIGIREKLCDIVSKVQQKDFPYLQHPGTIIYFQLKSDEEEELNQFFFRNESSSIFTSNIFLNTSMVRNHGKKEYFQGLKKMSGLQYLELSVI